MSDNKESNISIKPISDLLGYNFFIPSYQRGYRWTELQVKDLLNDVWDFIESDPTKEEWYCLQPVVVKAKNVQWEVIDGQQRLTTIFLVLKYLEKFVESERKTFDLEYETRNSEKSNSKDFLNNVEQKTEDEALDNIDYFHIYKAFETIKEWFKKKEETYSPVSSKCITPFLGKTKVIWYETNEDDAVQIFTRINMGKIALTNAELIKALFLNKSNFKTKECKNEDEKKALVEKIRLKQLEIANEWDFIEYSLHNEEFWWFINKDENEKDTRIEFLFELIVGKPASKEDDTYTFRKYAEKFQNKADKEKEIEENWKQVKRYFQTLQDWFNNRELYHKIGFLVTFGEDIKILIENSQTKSKTDFIGFIDGKINDKFENVQLIDLKKKDDAKIRRVLLMHNIQTMLNNEEENTKFPFNRYKKKTKDNKGWDIEHIHAIATEIPKKEEQQRDWLKYAKEVLVTKLEIERKKDDSELSNEEKSKKTETISNLEKLIDVQYDSSEFENFFNEISKYVNDEDVDDLPNLALLDLGTNRGYKNEFFSYKRNEIIKKDKTNTFIPICTKNAFMKYYTETDKIGQMSFWGEADRTAYFENIKEVLKAYLPTQND